MCSQYSIGDSYCSSLLGVKAQGAVASEEPILHQFFVSCLCIIGGVDVADGGLGEDVLNRDLLLGRDQQVSPQEGDVAGRYTGVTEQRS